MKYVRGVRARSARIFIISLKELLIRVTAHLRFTNIVCRTHQQRYTVHENSSKYQHSNINARTQTPRTEVFLQIQVQGPNTFWFVETTHRCWLLYFLFLLLILMRTTLASPRRFAYLCSSAKHELSFRNAWACIWALKFRAIFLRYEWAMQMILF